MPAPARVRAEYRSQFPDTAPDVAMPVHAPQLDYISTKALAAANIGYCLFNCMCAGQKLARLLVPVHSTEQLACVRAQTGRTELLTRLQRLLRAWGPMLQKFLRSHDDQVWRGGNMPAPGRTLCTSHTAVHALKKTRL